MALAVSFGFLIIRKEAISSRYPGGIDQFRQDWIPELRNRPRTGEDDQLFGFYSMGSYYYEAVERLREVGIVDQLDKPSPDVASGDIIGGFHAQCDWLRLETYEGEVNGQSGFAICWVKDSEQGEVVEARFY